MSNTDYETWIDSEVANTINTFENTDIRATNLVCLVYDARGNGRGGIAPTITGDHQNRITDYTAIVVEIDGETDNADRKEIL